MKRYKIAICDDEEFYIEDICQYYKAYESERNVEFEVSKFNNPMELTKLVSDGIKFDILILDVEMPEMSGVELAQEIRMIDKEVVICFATSSLKI